ncbi:syntaxin-binding protein 4-like isoform X4 [Natator depressus]|uniref:syntaxin-binding protein 4-like isoform X4 n=1 Tax=Natator depressus TaxID=27790 RepID=UPI003EB98CD6
MSYLRPPGRDLERFDGLSLIYWTLMGPYGMDRTVHCIDFYDCANGLGIKVIGGIKELTREEYGVYVKRILPGGVAYADGRLQPGDQILEVNGDSLIGVTSERAVDILRTASATNHMRLLIARDDDARREFSELLEKFGSHSNTESARSSPVHQGGSRYLESTSSGSSSRSQSPLLLSPANSHGPLIGNSAHSPHSSSQKSGGREEAEGEEVEKDREIADSGTKPNAELFIQQWCYSLESGIQCISIAKSSGLGLTISGGSNRPEGPMIYVQELMPEGDCCRDGRLRPGDQLIAINKDSLVGSTYEEARKILAKAKCRHEGNTEVAFIPGRGRLHPGLSVHNSIQSPSPKAMGNGLSSCRLKVHVRSPETRQENLFPVPSPSPDICPPELMISAPASPSGQRAASGSKPKVALDPHIRLKDGKLELTFDSVSCTDGEDLEQLQLEMTDLRQEVQRLKSLLKEVESSKKSMEYELQRLNQKALDFLSENRTLHSKLQVAEVVQQQAHSAEQDYEEVIHLLEAEITELKTQLVGKKTKHVSEAEGGILELKRQLSLADGQLRKSEVMRKRLEICNRKLLLFVQNVHRVLSTPSQLPDETRVNSRTEEDKTEANLDASLPSPDLLDLLISEAKELLEPILANTTKDVLPYNWDECLTGEGSLNYKDHLHQETTWPPPPTHSKSDEPQPSSPTKELPEKTT